MFALGPLEVRWYSMAYVVGILLGCALVHHLNYRDRGHPVLPDFHVFDDLLLYAILGIILGGRLGYVFFYQSDYYLSQPIEILKLWKGGMSFHGGLLGMIVAMFSLSVRKNYPFMTLMDFVAFAAPIGIGLGRVANFINGELYGRVTDVSWGMVFPGGGKEPRHPSQLYEAALEGVLLFLILAYLAYMTKARYRRGLLSGTFLLGYGFSRIFVEQFREPDPQLEFVYHQFTMGQILSLPMVALGIILIIFALKNPPVEPTDLPPTRRHVA